MFCAVSARSAVAFSPVHYGASEPAGKASGDGATGLLLANRLRFDLDAHGVADEHAAGLERLVPLQAPLPAIDLAARREAGPLFAPRILAGALERRIERHR